MSTHSDEPLKAIDGRTRTVRELLDKAKYAIDFYQREYARQERSGSGSTTSGANFWLLHPRFCASIPAPARKRHPRMAWAEEKTLTINGVRGR